MENKAVNYFVLVGASTDDDLSFVPLTFDPDNPPLSIHNDVLRHLRKNVSLPPGDLVDDELLRWMDRAGPGRMLHLYPGMVLLCTDCPDFISKLTFEERKVIEPKHEAMRFDFNLKSKATPAKKPKQGDRSGKKSRQED